MPSSSRSSRTRQSSKLSFGSRLPPGNSQKPPRCTSSWRLVTRSLPSRKTSAAATSIVSLVVISRDAIRSTISAWQQQCLLANDDAAIGLANWLVGRDGPTEPAAAAQSGCIKTAQMSEVPKLGPRSLADPMSDERSAAGTLLRGDGPGGLICFRIGIHSAGGIYILQQRSQVRQPHVRGEYILGGRIPTAVIFRAAIGKLAHAVVIPPRAAEAFASDGADQHCGVGHVRFAQQVHDALANVRRRPMIIGRDIVVPRELPVIFVGEQDLGNILLADVVEAARAHSHIFGATERRQ